jgi:dynein heavy chain 2
LPEINSDLIFKDNCVLFRPTYEELKHKYYQEIQKFITIPLRFLGVDNKKTDLFKIIPEQNSQHLNVVY